MTASGYVSVWHYLSPDHAVAAAYFSRKCAALEVELAGASNSAHMTAGSEGYREARFDHRSFAMGSIISAVAFLETCVSEILTAEPEMAIVAKLSAR
jgi:hypothetical protein